ncbi:MAG: hypothetical protein LAT82_05095 [Nanoarchaeota archaeon]|nr:hypothetical protein [Nanoarchaeota archaeon]
MKSKQSILPTSVLAASLMLAACSSPNRTTSEISSNLGGTTSEISSNLGGTTSQDNLEQRVLAPLISSIPQPRPDTQEFCGYLVNQLEELIPQGFSKISLLDDIPYSDLEQYESINIFKDGMPPLAFLTLNNESGIYFGAEYLDRLGRGDFVNVYAINGANKFLGVQKIDVLEDNVYFRRVQFSKGDLEKLNEALSSQSYLCTLLSDIVRANTSSCENDGNSPLISYRDVLESKES